ncbi:7869_t:CDS:2, partial [Dentiscutata erythropus]
MTRPIEDIQQNIDQTFNLVVEDFILMIENDVTKIHALSNIKTSNDNSNSVLNDDRFRHFTLTKKRKRNIGQYLEEKRKIKVKEERKSALLAASEIQIKRNSLTHLQEKVNSLQAKYEIYECENNDDRSLVITSEALSKAK